MSLFLLSVPFSPVLFSCVCPSKSRVSPFLLQKVECPLFSFHVFDDVLEDAAGELWVAEYKGGDGRLDEGQMELPWIIAKIAEMRRRAPGYIWIDKLQAALDQGKLHGILVKTPYLTPLKQEYGPTVVERIWNY